MPRSFSTTASASAAEAMTGAGGGAITRSVKIGPGLAVLRLEVIVFDRGDEPAIRVIRERSQIGPAVRLAHFAALFVFQRTIRPWC